MGWGKICSSMPRIYGFSILCENQSIGSYSRRNNHWTRPWIRSCDAINLQTLGHNLHCDIKRESERFVNEIHNHKAEVISGKELLDNLRESKRSEPHTRSKRKLGQLQVRRKLVQALSSLFHTKHHFFTRRIIPTTEKKWITVQAHSGYGSDSAVSIKTNQSLMV